MKPPASRGRTVSLTWRRRNIANSSSARRTGHTAQARPVSYEERYRWAAARFIEEARRLLADDAQRELDLGITPKAVKAEMVGPPAGTLFGDAAAGPAPRQLVARAQALEVVQRAAL